MGPWVWFVVIVAVGVCLLSVALLADRRRHRAATGAGEPAPLRSSDEVNRHVPTYITQDEIDDLPAPGRGGVEAVPHRGEGFGFGHAHPDFATQRDGASLDDPSLLIVAGMVESMRELFAPLAMATVERPLVIVADGFHPDVVATLAANRRAVALPVLAAVADRRDRLRLAELTGAVEVSPSDLQAGYVPPETLGRAEHWSSTGSRAWVQPIDQREPQP